MHGHPARFCHFGPQIRILQVEIHYISQGLSISPKLSEKKNVIKLMEVSDLGVRSDGFENITCKTQNMRNI